MTDPTLRLPALCFATSFAIAVAAFGCSRPVPASEAAPGRVERPLPPADDAAAEHAPTPVATTDAPTPPAPTASAVADPPPPSLASTHRFTSVLLAGDSMVGVRCCLSSALESRFRAEGARFASDAWSNVTTATYDHDARFAGLLEKTNPDLVLISLGTNDVFVPHPEALAANVASIAKLASAHGRACYWMGPPTWRGDTGIVDVIRRNAAPCKLFDATAMPLERIRDGVHVTDAGGAEWAARFWQAFRPTPLP